MWSFFGYCTRLAQVKEGVCAVVGGNAADSRSSEPAPSSFFLNSVLLEDRRAKCICSKRRATVFPTVKRTARRLPLADDVKSAAEEQHLVTALPYHASLCNNHPHPTSTSKVKGLILKNILEVIIIFYFNNLFLP